IATNVADISANQTNISANTTSISNLETTTVELRSLIDYCCDSGELQSEIDELKTSTGKLRALIGANALSIVTNQTNISADEILISNLETATTKLKSLIDYCCDSAELQSQIDELKTSTGELKDLIDANAASIVTNQINIAANVLAIDSLESYTGKFADCCMRIIKSDTYFTRTMLPKAGKTIIFSFDKCYASCDLPKLIFDPQVYGGGDEIALPENSKIIFDGEGIVQLCDGVTFKLSGTANQVDGDLEFIDCSQIVVQNKAIVTVGQDSLVSCIGCGKFVVRDSGSLILDRMDSQFVFGESADDALKFVVKNDGLVSLEHEDALLTFQLAQYVVEFTRSSILNIGKGVVEFNTNKAIGAQGKLIALRFILGSMLVIEKTIENDSIVAGILRLSPNKNKELITFDNFTSRIYGKGHLQFLSFNDHVSTRVLINDNHFENASNLIDIFIKLGTCEGDNGDCSTPAIFTREGSVDVVEDGRLAVFAPPMDGSIILLQEGDHDTCYVEDNPTIEMMGTDINGNLFIVDNNGNRITEGAIVNEIS
ncbi:hypothetical protein ACFLYA_02610, partial [Candidatus Dependentiae bacterium]